MKVEVEIHIEAPDGDTMISVTNAETLVVDTDSDNEGVFLMLGQTVERLNDDVRKRALEQVGQLVEIVRAAAS